MRTFLSAMKILPHPEEPDRISIRAGVSKDADALMQRARAAPSPAMNHTRLR